MTIRWEPTGRRYRGNGEAKLGEQFLAKVEYDLTERQEYLSVQELGSRKPLTRKGEIQIRGMITVLDGEKWLDKYDSFELHMVDNRVVQAKMVSRPRPYEPTFEVIVEFHMGQ